MTESEIKKLLDKYYKNSCSEKEERLVEDFLQSYQNNDAEWKEWKYGNSNEIDKKIFGKVAERLGVGKPPINTSRVRRQRIMIIASLLIITISSGIFYVLFQDLPVPNLIVKKTERGQKSSIILSDGSTVRLNSDSELIYPEEFSKSRREVKLVGEAFFDIARNEDAPFVIHTSKVTTTVLGTSFNIKAFKNTDEQITVATGIVSVKKRMGTNDIDEGVLITPSQQAIFSSEKDQFMVNEVDLDHFLSWKDGRIIFDKVSLEEASVILERWFNADITFEKKGLKECIIRGEYNNENLTNILKSLHFVHDVDYQVLKDNRVVITGSKCN